MGLNLRESTPGFQRLAVVFNAETRSSKRAAIVMNQTLGLQVSPNTINRLCQEAGEELAQAQAEDWQGILTGEVPVPDLAIVEYDGGRIRTRQMDCGPGVTLSGKGWNETKNAILVSATSTTSEVDPAPEPPACFLSPKHVAKLTETAKTKENARENDDLPTRKKTQRKRKRKATRAPHKPQRILRTVLSSMRNSQEFGKQMAREARRRRFDAAARKAFVGDGLACNWAIHEADFKDYTPILDFTHAVSYLFQAAQLCCASRQEAWPVYVRWMTSTWQGKVSDVIGELRDHQQRVGLPPEEVADDDPREQLRRVLGYLENNLSRMHYAEYRKQGLPTTSAWMESVVKEMNYRVKGTEMFWNNPVGAEAILQIRAAALSDDDRLVRFLSHRPGHASTRPNRPEAKQAA